MKMILQAARGSAVPAAFAALALVAWTSPAASGKSTSSFSYGFGNGAKGEDRFAYAIVQPSSRGEISISGDTDSDSWDSIRDLAKTEKRDVLWLRFDGRSYVSRDEDAIAHARAILSPLSRIGARQGELGQRQSELGARQSELGARQSTLGAQQSRLGERLGRVQERYFETDRGSASRRALAMERDGIQREMRELGARMEDLGRRQSVLGASQAALGREQSALGRQQAEESQKAQVAMRRLARELMAAGELETID